MALVALPFLVVTTPPITDLPQQTAQMRLLTEVLASEGDSPYRVQWLDPNKLGYLPLAVGWLAASPLRAGGVAMMLVAWAWVLAIHGLARVTERPVAAAALASIFFFNHVTYWGFVSFLTGLPAFMLWLWVLRDDAAAGAARATWRTTDGAAPADRRSWRRRVWTRGLGVAGAALLLYAAHVLWLAAGWLWLLLESVARRRPLGELLGRLAWTSPAAMLVTLWYPRFAASGFDSATTWGQGPLGRLAPEWLVSSALGGLRGPVPGMVLLAVAGWTMLGVWQHRRELAAVVDRRLLAVALLFLFAAFLLPQVTRHTIFFASRWLPVAMVFGVLALPAPRLRPALRLAVPLLLLAALSLATANVWIGFEREELDGFHDALAALPPEPVLLGLDFVRQSPRVRDYPYYHLYAYGQALRGGRLNRSFADQASSLVVFRDLPKSYPWTRDLDWKPQLVRESDVGNFDHVLIFGDEAIHARFRADPRLLPVTDAPAVMGPAGKRSSRWRLYRVEQIP